MLPEPFAPLTLARILRPWGRHGEVAAEILTDFPERLTEMREVWLAGERGAPRAAKIISCRIHLGQAIFHFDGVQTISDAEVLRGLEVQVPLGERVRLGEGRYFIYGPGRLPGLGTRRDCSARYRARGAASWRSATEPAAGILEPRRGRTRRRTAHSASSRNLYSHRHRSTADRSSAARRSARTEC